MLVSQSLRVLMAATVSVAMLAGCNPKAVGPAAPGTQPVPQSQVSQPQSQAANDAQTASQIQRDMDDTDMMGESEAGFATQVLGQPAAGPGQVSATGGARLAKRLEVRAGARAAALGLKAEAKTKLLAKRVKLHQKAANRLKANLDAFKKGVQKEEAANDLGGKTVTMTFNVTLGNGGTRSGTMERVYNGDKVLVSANQVMDWAGKNGRTRHMERTKELQADGSYLITGTATESYQGQSRTYTWTRTITADGAVSGTGTMTKADGKTVTVTFGGTEEAETTTVTDPTTQTTAVAETTPDAGADTAVTVTTSGTTTEVAVAADAGTTTETPAPTESASPAPAATASPASDTAATAS